MATRFYIPRNSASTAIAPTGNSEWEVKSDVVRARLLTTPVGDSLGNLAYADANNTDKDILLLQLISDELVAGQLIQLNSSLLVMRASETSSLNNLRLAATIRVIAADGTTVRSEGSVLRDNSEVSTSLTSRLHSFSPLASSYTTVAGDRLVVEIGLGGDPSSSGNHTGVINCGDAAASWLPTADNDSSASNPFLEVTETLSFVVPDDGGTSIAVLTRHTSARILGA